MLRLSYNHSIDQRSYVCSAKRLFHLREDNFWKGDNSDKMIAGTAINPVIIIIGCIHNHRAYACTVIILYSIKQLLFFKGEQQWVTTCWGSGTTLREQWVIHTIHLLKSILCLVTQSGRLILSYMHIYQSTRDCKSARHKDLKQGRDSKGRLWSDLFCRRCWWQAAYL